MRTLPYRMDFKHWLPTRHPRARIDLTNWLWRSDIQKGAAVSLRSGRSCFSFLLNPILNRRCDGGGAGGDLFLFSATLLAAVFVYVFEELLTHFETLFEPQRLGRRNMASRIDC